MKIIQAFVSITLVLALAAYASMRVNDSGVYALQPKAGDTAGSQFKSDLAACQHATSQRYTVQDPQPLMNYFTEPTQ